MTNCAPGGAYNFVMDIIYIDRLFLLNLVLDYLIVLCSARLCGIRLRRARYAAAAGFGALVIIDGIVNKNRIKGDYLECEGTDEI